jgi:type II secretory ATPase GspE/PulE/Tfp pilus assembly ATPase PilB-like protein
VPITSFERWKPVEKMAIEQGMRTLLDDGVAEVAADVTTLEEVDRVLT